MGSLPCAEITVQYAGALHNLMLDVSGTWDGTYTCVLPAISVPLFRFMALFLSIIPRVWTQTPLLHQKHLFRLCMLALAPHGCQYEELQRIHDLDKVACQRDKFEMDRQRWDMYICIYICVCIYIYVCVYIEMFEILREVGDRWKIESERKQV